MKKRNIYTTKWDKHWESQTFNAWWLPQVKFVPRNNVDSEKEDKPTMRHCLKCDSVYDRVWTNSYYKVYIWDDFPKNGQKKRDCPACKKTKDYRIVVGGNL